MTPNPGKGFALERRRCCSPSAFLRQQPAQPRALGGQSWTLGAHGAEGIANAWGWIRHVTKTIRVQPV